MTRTVAAFRAYRWGPDIALLAHRFFAQCPGARHVVLLNETDGPIDIGEHEKVAHGSDFGALGLPEHPVGRSLWFNGDYAYVFLRRALPDHDYYLIVESDVAVNLPLAPMVEAAAEGGIDAVMHQLRPAHPDWVWYQQACAQPEPWTAFLFVCLFSARALDALLAERQALARRRAVGALMLWPIVESFVPTTLRVRQMRIAELAAFADVEDLRYRPQMRLRDPRAQRPGTLVHPVLGSRELVRSLLGEHAPGDYHVPGTVLRQALADEPLADIAGPLHDAFARIGDHQAIALLHREMLGQGLPFPHARDLAHCKPATISSVSPWSRGGDPRLDAAGANGVTLHDDGAFHTAAEPDAWWMVDLLEEFVVERVEIVNRATFGDRFRTFVIEGSRDGAAWRTRHVKEDDGAVSADAAQPWSVSVDDPFVARHVRGRRLGAAGFLHLRRVRVFGRSIAP